MGCILVSIVHAFDCKIGENLDEYEIKTYYGCPILPHSCRRKMPEWEDPYMCPNFYKAQYVQMVKKSYGKKFKPTLLFFVSLPIVFPTLVLNSDFVITRLLSISNYLILKV